MLLLSQSIFKQMILVTKWLLFHQVESTSFHKHICQSLMESNHHFSLWAHQFQVKFKIGLELIPDAKCNLSTQMKTDLFLTMEENTPTKLLFLLQDSTIKVQILRV